MTLRRTSALLGALALGACQAVPAPANEAPPARVGSIEAVPPPLALQPEEAPAGEVAYTIAYARPPNRPGPRAAELQFRHGDGVEFVRAEALSAIQVAGKQLIAQARADHEVRVVVLSPASLTTLDSGPLVRLVLRRIGPGSTSLELLDRRPFFAPPEADLALGPLSTMDVRAEATP